MKKLARTFRKSKDDKLSLPTHGRPDSHRLPRTRGTSSFVRKEPSSTKSFLELICITYFLLHCVSYVLNLSTGFLSLGIARTAGSELEVMKELDSSSTKDGGVVANHVNRIKLWLLSHSQYLNFLMILVLASVPNPLFDLAGIMCVQFGIPFWTFFISTMIGKAFIKTHIQVS